MKAPAFQFYAKDWDTGTARMSLPARGLYISMLAVSWDSGPMPEDSEDCAALVRVRHSDFVKAWGDVKAKWVLTTKGYINERLEQEREKQRLYRAQQADKGRRSAEQRFNRGSTVVQPKGEPNTQPNTQPEGQPKSNSSSASSSALDLASATPKENIPMLSDHSVSPRMTKPSNAHYPPDFAPFWAAYPRKVGKGDAAKAWAKVTPKLSVVLDALRWQSTQPAWTKDAGQFIPHPATWLNQRRWEDEPFNPPLDLAPQRGDTIGVHNAKVGMSYLAKATTTMETFPDRPRPRELKGHDDE